MKTTPSGTLTIVALVGLGIAGVLTFRATAQPPKADNFELTIPQKQGDYWLLKKNDCDGENQFMNLLKNGPYDKTKKLHFKHKNPSQQDCDLPDDCAACIPTPTPRAQLNIKTDKVTVANAAQSVADGDPHVTIQVASKSPAAIKAVVDLLAEP